MLLQQTLGGEKRAARYESGRMGRDVQRHLGSFTKADTGGRFKLFNDVSLQLECRLRCGKLCNPRQLK